MQLKILLPFKIFVETDKVTRIVAETRRGSFGLLSRRLDCVAALSAGILIYSHASGPENYVAVDEGILVKTGDEVQVCVRHAIGGSDLGKLRETVDHEFLTLDEQEKSVRSVMAKLETGFVQGFVKFQSL